MTAQCVWAPVLHDVPARYVATLIRECGHRETPAPSCVDHAVALRARPVAENPSACRTCGAVGNVAMTSMRTLR